jgi:TonB family protein
MPEKIDIEASKNEDSNKLKLSDLNKRLHKDHLGGEKKTGKHKETGKMTAHTKPVTLAMRSALFLLLSLHPQTRIFAQEQLNLPPWIAKAIGQERAQTNVLVDDGRFHDEWVKETYRPHRFIGHYKLIVPEDSTEKEMAYTAECWQDANRSVVILEAQEYLRITYLTDLEADAAVIAYHHETMGDQVLVAHISTLLKTSDWCDRSWSRERAGYEASRDSLSGRKAMFLGRRCDEHLLKGKHNTSWWVDPGSRSPFDAMESWMPSRFKPFEVFSILSSLGPGFPMEYREGRDFIRITAVNTKLTELPPVDLGHYELVRMLRVDHGQSADNGEPGVTMNSATTEEIFPAVHDMPQFPGGEEAFKAYLKANIRYPEMEMDNSIQGKVYLSFVVAPDGLITDIQPFRTVHMGPGLTKEAIRVLKAMPRWTPGRHNGVAVRVRMNVPVEFKLE